MRTVGIARVKNEARWIKTCLSSLAPICDRLVVFDDNSSDGTPDLARHEGAEVIRSPFQDLHESRDKNYILEHANLADGDAVIWIDGDESLHPLDQDLLRAEIRQPRFEAYSVRILYLWNAPNLVRVDGVYGRFQRPSIFRYRSDQRFGKGVGPGFHCSNVPENMYGRGRESQVRFLHYGYMLAEDRIRKYHWYGLHHPGSQAEDGYRHMVIGDLFPGTSRFRNGGPLRLVSLERLGAALPVEVHA